MHTSAAQQLIMQPHPHLCCTTPGVQPQSLRDVPTRLLPKGRHAAIHNCSTMGMRSRKRAFAAQHTASNQLRTNTPLLLKARRAMPRVAASKTARSAPRPAWSAASRDVSTIKDSRPATCGTQDFSCVWRLQCLTTFNLSAAFSDVTCQQCVHHQLSYPHGLATFNVEKLEVSADVWKKSFKHSCPVLEDEACYGTFHSWEKKGAWACVSSLWHGIAGLLHNPQQSLPQYQVRTITAGLVDNGGPDSVSLAGASSGCPQGGLFPSTGVCTVCMFFAFPVGAHSNAWPTQLQLRVGA